MGLVYFCVRGMTPAQHWSDRMPLWSLRLFHTAIVLWLVLNIIPIGIGQFVAGIQQDYWYSRSLDFYNGWTFFQWLRLPGDLAFLAAGVIVLVDLVAKLRFRKQATVTEGQEVRVPLSGPPAAAVPRL